MTPEFSRPERIDMIGEGERRIAIEADADERRRLAARFALVSIERLAARFALRREGGSIRADGQVEAEVTQACSVSGVNMAAQVNEAVTLRFVTADLGGGEEEVELTDEALDTLPIEDDAIDLGEAAAETMALALDPFPRAAGAEAALRGLGILGEGETGPFSGLAALKGRLQN